MPHTSRLALVSDVLFHHILSTKKKPLLASYKLTYRCNLRCQQCPFPGYPGDGLTFNQVCRVLDRLYERGNRLVIFEGGEPLLWRDSNHTFADVVHYARERFACVGVTTNGTLPLMVETDICWVSLDGFEATHNRLRQADIFERVIENIRRSAHPRLFAHITINAENYTEIPDLVRYLSGLVQGITIQFYYPYGEDEHLFLRHSERRALLQRLLEMKKEGIPILNSTASMRALQDNRWTCMPWLIDCVNPDGTISQGCYLQGRATIDCRKCGFSPYTEMSLAFQGHPASILAGMKIFI